MGKSKRQSGEEELSWLFSEFHHNSLPRTPTQTHTLQPTGDPRGVTWDFWVQGSPVWIIMCFQWSSGRGDRGLPASPRFKTWVSQHSRSIPLTLLANSVTVRPRPLGPLYITGALHNATGPRWDQAGFLQLHLDVPDVSTRLTIQNRTLWALIRALFFILCCFHYSLQIALS